MSYRSLKKVTIDNFQIHKHTEVEFSSFTGILGSSDKGKSAILRAVFWCLYNYPSGSSFIRQGSNKACVTVEFDDGLVITRTKGSSVNSYDIYAPGLSPMHLEGFGVGSVEEVVAAHGMREVDYFGDKQSLNVCKQLSQPFFLGESPTTKALIIGKLANTDVVDLSIKNVSSEIRTNKSVLKTYKQELKSVKSELSELRGLNTMEKAINQAEAKLDKMKVIDMKLKNISSINSKLEQLTSKKDSVQSLIECEEGVAEAITIIDEVITISSRVNKLKSLYHQLKIERNRYSELQSMINDITPNDIYEQIENINTAISYVKNINKVNDIKNKLEKSTKTLESLKSISEATGANEAIDEITKALELVSVMRNITSVNSKLIVANERERKGTAVINKLNAQYSEAINSYKDGLVSTKSCPICMSKLSEDKLTDIEKMI